MAGYIIVDINVHDSAGYEEYKALAGGTAEAYGGRYLVRGGAMELLEGNWIPKRFVILEFPSMEQAKQWYHSPEYRQAIGVRQKTAHSNMILVEGLKKA